MSWIRSDFKIIQELRSSFTPDHIRKLEQLHIHTLEDLLAFCEIEGLEDLLTANLELEHGELSTLVGKARRELSLAHLADLLKPIEQDQLDNCSFGLLEPEDTTRTYAAERQGIDGEMAFHGELKETEVDHISRLKPVLNQGQRGTCVAFGTTAVREFFTGKDGPKLSEQYLYWGAKQRDGHENEVGTWIRYAIQCLEESGICREETWPYNPYPGETEHQGPPPPGAEREACRYRIVKGIPITGNSVDSMRAVLAGTSRLSARVIAFGIPVFRSWRQNPITFRTGRIPMPLPDEPHVGGHCMTLVGYKDDDTWPGGGYFIFRNSWGEGWARECEYGAGYGTIPYAFMAEYGWEAWTMEVEKKEGHAVSDNTFSMKKILLGILLGLAIVTGLMLYPDISEMFQSSTPQAPEDSTTVTLPKDPSTILDQESAGDPKESDQTAVAPVEDTTTKPVSTMEETAKRVEPYYAEEEALWQELLSDTLNPEYLAEYPYAECFRASAVENNIPASLVLGISGYLSNFDPESKMNNKSGIMHLDPKNRTWPLEPEKDEASLEPCQDIAIACRYLAGLISKGNDELVPALVAYREQLSGVHPENIKREDLLFASRLRRYVATLYTGPYKKKVLYPIKEFDSLNTAKRFIESIKKSSGVDLSLDKKGLEYVVSILAVDENEKNEKAALIEEKAGIKAK